MLNKATSRRAFVQHIGSITAGSLLLPTTAIAQSDLMKATPECNHTPTRAQTAGPFFTPNTPLRNDFRNDDPKGEPFQLVGFVKSPGCRPRQGPSERPATRSAAGAAPRRNFTAQRSFESTRKTPASGSATTTPGGRNLNKSSSPVKRGASFNSAFTAP